MNASSARRDKLVQFLALGWLLMLGGLALFGPYGLLSWGELKAKLAQREQQIQVLLEQMAVLENRKDLLDPRNVDPDLASELVRQNLNVVHPDEYVIDLEVEP